MDFLSCDEACERLGVKPETLYAYASRGLVRRRSDGGRTRFYDAGDITRLQRQAAKARQKRPAPERVDDVSGEALSVSGARRLEVMMEGDAATDDVALANSAAALIASWTDASVTTSESSVRRGSRRTDVRAAVDVIDTILREAHRVATRHRARAASPVDERRDLVAALLSRPPLRDVGAHIPLLTSTASTASSTSWAARDAARVAHNARAWAFAVGLVHPPPFVWSSAHALAQLGAGPAVVLAEVAGRLSTPHFRGAIARARTTVDAIAGDDVKLAVLRRRAEGRAFFGFSARPMHDAVHHARVFDDAFPAREARPVTSKGRARRAKTQMQRSAVRQVVNATARHAGVHPTVDGTLALMSHSGEVAVDDVTTSWMVGVLLAAVIIDDRA